MPWGAKDAVRHNRKATGAKAKQWSAVANAVLKKTGDEGKAIRIANSAVSKSSQGETTVRARKRK